MEKVSEVKDRAWYPRCYSTLMRPGEYQVRRPRADQASEAT